MHSNSSSILSNLRAAARPMAGPWRPAVFGIAFAVCAWLAPAARAQSLYWDSNADTAGAGTTPTGIWGTDSYWSTDPLGLVVTGAWVGGNDAVFSAGTDAAGPYTVTLSGAQTAGSLSFEEGNVTLSGVAPATNLTWNGQVSVASGASGTLGLLLSGSGGLAKSGDGLLSLVNTNDFTGSVVVSGGTLAFGSTSQSDTYLGAIPGGFNQTAVTLQDSTTLRLNSQIVTFATNRGLTIGGSGANLDANAGAILFIPNVVDGPGTTVTKTGAGEVGFYGAANTFAKLVIDQGNLRIGQSTFAGSDLSYGAVPAVPTPDAITIRNGATNRVVGSTAVTIHANRGITLGVGGGVFRNDISPVILTINSAITGPGGLRKEGGQNLTNNGPRSYEGPTVINGGALSLTAPVTTFNGQGTGTGALLMNSGRLLLNHDNAFSSVTIAGGRIDVNTNGCLGTGAVILSPTNSITVVNATTLGVGPLTNVTLNNDFVINPGATLAGGGVALDIAANSGRELILNGKVSGAAHWKKDNGGTGTLVLGNPNNDFTGVLTNFGGTLMAAANNALGATSGGTHINSGGSLAFRGGINYSAPEPVNMSGLGRFTGGAISNESGNNSFSGPITMVGDGSVGGMIGTTLTLNEAIGESGGARILYKLGQGSVKLAAPAGNAYTGGTIISNGVLVACNLTGSATGPGPITIYPPGALAGPGFVAGDLVVNGILSPGGSPGTLNTGNETWNGGGTYLWEINDVDAGQGVDPGWDLVNITGTLTINATSGSKFNIDLTSLTLANAAGSVHDFDASTDYVWTILKTTGGITGFDPAAFNVLASNFSNPVGAGLFLIETANSGNDLVIRFVRAPAIAAQPANQIAECATGSATFSVGATGTAPLTYQWRRNGVDIDGATAATLIINPTTTATAGSYDVVVVNAYGSATSAAATLTLVDTTLPVITTCAPNQTLSVNANCQAAIPDLTGQVVASDTCGPVTISQSPTAGTLVGLGTHSVTITVTDGASLTATCSPTVTVNDTTAPTITACAPNQSLTATLAGCQAALPDLTGLVTAGDNCPGAVTVTQSPLAGTLVGLGSTAVTLTATDVAGNAATCPATVTVNSGVTATVNSATICAGGSATLTATTGAANPSYLWSPGGATTASIMVSPTETTVYTVTVTDGVTGCTGNGSGTVTIAPALVVTVNSATICAGGSATLAATTDAVAPTYLWSPGGATTASITVSPTETTVYMVTVTDGAGCTGNGSGTVTVNPLPTVSVNSPTICAGASAMLTATTTAANPTYLWSPGGETTPSITVSPAVMTTYTVTVTDGVTTCANTASGTVTITPLPTVSVNSETICSGGSATLTATTSASNPSYLWSPGGATAASIMVSPTETTVYTVTVTDGVTTCAGTASGTVTVNPLPTVTVESPLICIGGSATLTATTSAANPTYLWSPGGETTASITVMPAATTTYTVTVTDGTTTCAGTGAGTVTVNPLPTVSVNSETICAGASAVLTATTAAANPSYLWSPGGETTASISVSPAVMTTYSVTVTDGVTTCANNASGTVTVTPLPTVSVNSETICSGGSATLTATTAASNPSYLWSPGGATTASINVTPTETTVYTVTVTNGTTTCANSASGTVTVNPLPTVAVNSPSICPGDSATLTATTSASNPSYLWSPGGETTASITVTPAATTTYSVTVTDNATGCVGNGSGAVTVRVPETFANTGAIAINDFTAASPYPSVINVSGLTSTVCRVTITLNNLGHAFPDDLDIVLIAPNGQGVLLLSDVGGANPVSGLTLTLDDSAPGGLPDSAVLTSGTYKPTNIGAKSDNRPDNFPPPVPVVNFVTNLSAFAGINPNGAWSLFINDDEQVDVGSVGGGWSLALTTLTPIADLAVAQTPIPNPVGVGSNLTFNVTVSNLGPAGADAVSLTDTLPAGMTFVSATPSQGSCVEAAGVVTCALGSLAANASATVAIVVTPTAAGVGNNVATVTAATLDLAPGNNSTTAGVTVLDPPVIVTGPANQTVCKDQSALFTVTASGAAPLSYQWYLNNVAIGGATAPSLAIASAQAGDAGTYNVIVSNSVGAAEASATLIVNPLPTVSVNSETICVGQSATLMATTDAANPSFLWSPGGATTASITVNPASTTIYTVLVTDGVTGCTNSASGAVTVKELTTATALTSINNLCPGSPAIFSTTAGGDGPFTYVWRKDGALLAETSATLSIAAVAAADAGIYTVEVTGFCNTVTNSATLTVVAPPSITAQPQNQATPMGNGAVFSVTATGVGPITYQWRLNGAELSGATASSLAVSNVTLAQSGDSYSVTVSNCAGAVLSASAVLTVTPIAGISFDFDTPGQFTNAPYYLTYNNWINNGFIAPPAVFESAIGGVGPYPGGGSLDMPPNNGTDNTSIILPVNYDFSLPGKTLYASTMFKVKTPQNATRRATQIGFVTSTNLGLADQTPQGFMSVILQSGATTPVNGWNLRTQRRNTGGGLQESTNFIAPLTLTVSNWYRLNATFINTKTAGNNTYTLVCSLQDMGPLGTTPGATNATFTTTTNNADIVNFRNVFFALRSFEDGGMEFRDNTYVWTTPGNVFFVQQPQHQTVRQGQRAEFRALVDGEGPYTYQWSRNGTPIPGARSWNYLTPPTLAGDSGAQYTVEVTGPANAVTSDPATLTVTAETLAVVSAGSVDGTTVGVKFSQPVQPASAENAANYSINGVAPVQARVYRSSLGAQGPDGIYVVLTPASVLSGAFTVTVSGVQDLSGGTLGGANSANGSVAGLTGFDVNPLVTGPPGENYSFGPGQFIVTGGGPDIFGVADGFRYVYTTKTGDFDVVVKVPHMDTVRFVSKAGLDVRTSLDPFSPNVLASFNPGPIGEGGGALRQFTEGNIRHTYNAASAGWGANARLFPPDVWMRLRRVGNTFLRYSGSNGTSWAFDGQISPSPAMPPTVYFGLAVCSVRNLQSESAQFENYGDFAGYAGAAITINSQPTNLTVTAGSAATIGGLIASVSGGGIPGFGELTYLWQRDDGAGGWTNMPSAGATNNVLAVGTVFSSDHGAQYQAVVMVPGALSVTSSVVTLTVTDAAAPTLTSANAAVMPSYPVSEVLLNFSEPLSAASATDAANYTVTNAAGLRLTVLSAGFLHGDPRTVILKVDGQLGSGNASVGVGGVRDLSNTAIATTVRTFRTFLPSTAPVVVEVYQDIGNATDVASLTGHALFTGGTPTFIVYSNLFGFNVQNNFTGIQDNYGVKVYTYFVPPTSGAYKFWIRSDDAMQLFLNTNAVNSTDPAGRVLIAANTGANNNYTVGTTPASSITNITLIGGQAYYMEALLKEGAGGDGFSVTTTAPTVNTAPGTGTFIPTAQLAYPSSAAPSTPVVMDVYTGYQNFLAGFNQLAGLTQATNFPTGNYAIDTVNFKYIAGVPDVIGYQKYFGAQPVTLGNTRLDNYLGRLQSYFIPPSTGLYRFWMGVDDVGHLYMNTNAVNSTDPAGMVLLGTSANAFVSTASQLVAQNVPLIGGQRYYMMALWREGGGGDGIRLAVRPQSDGSTPPTTEIIPASMLEYPVPVGRAGMVNFTGIVPANPTVIDGRPLTLSAAGIVGAPPYGFVWLKNGVRVLDNSFTNITPPLTLSDLGAVYTLIVTNLFSSMERSVTVTVLPDGTAPTIVRTVGRRYNDGFTIQFSEPMDAASATYLGNYQVSGGLALRNATLDPTRTMVSFETAQQLANTTYNIVVNGVRDASSAGNLIAPNTMTSFSTWSVGGSGFLVELFTNIANTAVSDLTGTPKFAANLPDVVYYTNVFGMGAFGANTGLENYGGRITGYFVPTNTGYYRFYVRSDDASQLWMNINSADSENPAGRTMLIHMPNANITMQDPRAISPPVFLNQGQRYYIEGLMKEGGGGDYFLATFRSTDASGTAVGAVVPPLDTVAELQPASAFDGAPGDPSAIQIVQTPPSDVFVVENELVSLKLVASIPANMLLATSYRWQKFDGAAYTNIPGATTGTLNFFANLSDDLAQYRLVFSAPGRNASYVTTLHVSPDGQAPYLVSASSLDGRTIGLCFNERLQTAAAVDTFNYSVNGGATTVILAQQRPDLRSVVLTLETPISGEFTVRADFQVDLAASPNEGSSSTNGVVQGYNAPTDIGGPTVLGSSFSCVEGEIDVIAGGADIWGNADQGHLTLATRKGDFDVWTRVQTLTRSGADNSSKAGIMVRENMDAGSRTMNYLLTPPPSIGGRNIYEAAQRAALNGATANWAGGNDSAAPSTVPDAWIRIKREGALFTGYRSTNGMDWILTTTNVMPMSNSVLVGFATTAHNNAGPAVLAEYRNIHLPLAPVILVQPLPAAQSIALGGSASYSVVVSNRPNSGPLRLQWRKNGVAIPGATSAMLALNTLSGSDAGTYTVVASNDGGEGDESNPVVLNVANGLPLIGSETLVTTQGMTLTVTGSSLIGNDMDPEGAVLALLGVNGVCSSLVRTDFETGLPLNSAIYAAGIGGASIDVSGGTGNSRVLKLTQPFINQAGSIIFDDLGAGAPMAGFTASFNLRIGNASAEPADGFSFNFAGDLPIGPSTPAAAENGGGAGFSFCIDNYRFAPYPGGGTANTSGMKLRLGGVDVAGVQMPTWNSTAYIPVSITLTPDGALTVLVDGTNVFGNLVLPIVPTVGRFGLYARTGGQFQTHWLDDLIITPIYRTPNGGLVSLDSGSGDITYTPPAGFCGLDSFAYLVNDGQQGGTACGVVTVRVIESTLAGPTIGACATNRILVVPNATPIPLPDLTGDVVATDNCCCVAVTQSPAAGALIGPGSTVVTLTATDVAGLTTTCQATVTVIVPTSLTGATYAGGTFSASFQTVAGLQYTVEYTDNLNTLVWTTLTVITGDGTLKSFTDPGPLPPTRFYRISIGP